MSDTEKFLAHHGIKGMKWGVRRKVSSARAASKAKKDTGSVRPSDEGKAAHKILAKQKKYGTVALTNHELRVVNARIKLEKELHGHFPSKTKLDKGEAHLKRFVAIAGSAKTAYEIMNSDAGKKMTGRGAKIMATTAAKAVT